MNFFWHFQKKFSDLIAFERGCLSCALKFLQFFKIFGTPPCRSYESMSKLGALTVFICCRKCLRYFINVLKISFENILLLDSQINQDSLESEIDKNMNIVYTWSHEVCEGEGVAAVDGLLKLQRYGRHLLRQATGSHNLQTKDDIQTHLFYRDK